MFMGTPHSGSPAAPIGKAIANMVAITGHADDRLLKHLTEHSEYSQRQISQFSNISRDFKIYYVYETLKTRVKGTPKMIEVGVLAISHSSKSDKLTGRAEASCDC